MKTMTLLGLGLTLIAAPVFAHAFLESAVPLVGSTVNTPPKEIRITYTEEVEPTFSHVDLFTADGKQVATGTPAVDPKDHKILIAPVTGQLPPGHYEVRWAVVAVDTHHTNGHYTFDYQP
jgi:methionine-rich copper-binding protein CopC